MNLLTEVPLGLGLFPSISRQFCAFFRDWPQKWVFFALPIGVLPFATTHSAEIVEKPLRKQNAPENARSLFFGGSMSPTLELNFPIIKFDDRTPDSLPHTPWFSMGTDIADINNDGRMDLFATDMAGSTHYNEKMQMGNMSGPDSDVAVYCSGTKRPKRFNFVTSLLSKNWTKWAW